MEKSSHIQNQVEIIYNFMARFVPIIYSLEGLTISTIRVKKESKVSIKRKFLLKQIILMKKEGKRKAGVKILENV